jgi:uncharacterized membrane protein YeaQ/YmgE (transglycosylase-associated protein family)
MKIKILLTLVLIISGIFQLRLGAAENAETQSSNIKERIEEVAADIGEETKLQADTLLQKFESGRLKHRTRDEIVSWILVGVLVGSLAGMMSTRKRHGYGLTLNLLVGLAGAFLGGMIVHVAEVDLGWGMVQVRYEEFLAGLAGALLIVCLVKFLQWRGNSGRVSSKTK